MCCVGAILPLFEHDWLKWSHDKHDPERHWVRIALAVILPHHMRVPRFYMRCFY